MSPILEKREPKPAPMKVLYRAPPALVAEIDQAAKAVGMNRTEVMTKLLRFALDALKKEKKKAT